VVPIRTDHGRKFDHDKFVYYCHKNDISHTSQHPGLHNKLKLLKMKKNRTLEDIAKTLICENDFSKSLWAETIDIANYIFSKCLTRPLLRKTPYELFKGKKLKVSYFTGL